jgi:hypothetical protein
VRSIERQQLAPWVGVPRGNTYPLAPDVEGSQSPLLSLLLFNLPKFELDGRLRWLRVVGVDRLVLFDRVAERGSRRCRGAAIRRRELAVWRRVVDAAGVWPQTVEAGTVRSRCSGSDLRRRRSARRRGGAAAVAITAPARCR